ncbi:MULTISPECIES: tetratricopeptide repeat protein [Paraburkholderia]|uniref:Tetratricopeptide repeat protein n=1 Tax=Paraburkholderia madseniana TaxID=2599607 RepID=A0AAP5ELY4_9BURK|nr:MULTISPECIES: tetratricopeptide repeat protein [Paraburkholderia]MCX4144000.1 tetratricopeptide repeat protein [Paraburkholderia madseniana]MDN7146954.1 tetratricopeptide repeat protein [Paraburkholderia sp. WS6]MDQ6405834.1 tetratricopeptide repeat protein [Paraburkholderia madseniana]
MSSDDPSVWYEEAVEAYHAHRFSVVQTLVDRILGHEPEHAHALHLRGLLALVSNQNQVAQRWVERAIDIRPHPSFYNTLYAIHLSVGDFDRAVQTLRQGLALYPDFPRFHYNMALTLHHLDCPDEAVISYRRTLELDPDNSEACNNLGLVFRERGAFDDAQQYYRRAITLAPTNLSARSNLGNLLLATGRYEEAWPYFEDHWVAFRDTDGRPNRVRPQVALPQWKGESPCVINRTTSMPERGARLLVLHEQGYGDSLQFVRYLPLALERFSLVAYVCPPNLRRLYQQALCSRWPGLVLLDAVPADVGGWDWYCPLMSLPMAFGTRLDNVPAAVPYLYADPEQAACWHARFAAVPAPHLPRVGVVWAGGHSGWAEDKVRSLTFAQIAPLLALSHVRWINLQKTDDPEKRPDAASKALLTDWMDEVTDFADTAALIENLDLVISVDTSVAHLAAAMGKPMWLLNRFAGCWRWLHDRDDSPWYPTLRLFNQSQRGNWDDVLARVATALQEAFSPHDARCEEETDTRSPIMLTPSPVHSDDIATWYGEAQTAHREGHFDIEQTLLDRILVCDPKHVGALYSRGVLALVSGQFESAQNWIKRAIEVQPDANYYNILNIVQAKLGAFASAIESAQRAVALQPDVPMLHHNLATTLMQQGRLEDAAISFRRVLELEPERLTAHTSLGDVFMQLGALDEAERHYRYAHTLAPADLETHAALAVILLTAGRYEEAWPFYENRWAMHERPDLIRPQLPLPQWKGENSDVISRTGRAPDRGARLVVVAEQGIGDNLQFIRYLPLALERFSHVGFICPPPLRRLFKQSLCSRWPGLMLVDTKHGGPRDWDWYCPLMSLPMALGTRLDTIPATTPYLYAHGRQAARWRVRLASLPNANLPRVGVVWAGNSDLSVDRQRSLTSAQIAPLVTLPQVRWISLQKTDDPAKRPDAASKERLTDWTDELSDFADTAALIDNLDLVISVDTSVAHLAAAMGKPVWLLNRFAGCWRWLRGRDDSPWYPSLRIFTQSQRGNWDDVLARVAVALQQRFPPHDARCEEERGLPHAGNQTP